MELFTQIIINSLISGTQVLLLATGLFLVYSVTRIMHVGLGAIAMLLAYIVFSLLQTGVNLFLLFFLFLISALILTTLSYWLLKRFIDRDQNLLGLLMSLTIGVFLESILSIIFGPEGRFINLFETQSYFFSGITVTNVGILTLALGICLFTIGLFILRSTPEGRKLRATSSNKNLAIVLGIKTQTVFFITLFFATTIAGLVGVLKGMYSAVTPLAGLNLIILSFIALIVGGPNDYRGTIVASYILVLIPELLISLSIESFTLSSSWKMVFVFIIATFLLTLKPQGLFYSVTRNT